MATCEHRYKAWLPEDVMGGVVTLCTAVSYVSPLIIPEPPPAPPPAPPPTNTINQQRDRLILWRSSIVDAAERFGRPLTGNEAKEVAGLEAELNEIDRHLKTFGGEPWPPPPPPPPNETMTRGSPPEPRWQSGDRLSMDRLKQIKGAFYREFKGVKPRASVLPGGMLVLPPGVTMSPDGTVTYRDTRGWLRRLWTGFWSWAEKPCTKPFVIAGSR